VGDQADARLGDLIYVGQVAELQRIVHGDDWIEIGAGVTVERVCRARRHVSGADRNVEALRVAADPQRGTLGGNVANGSPIGDSMPG
jgi:xanthine dehydrogenase small subunit